MTNFKNVIHLLWFWWNILEIKKIKNQLFASNHVYDPWFITLCGCHFVHNRYYIFVIIYEGVKKLFS